MNEKLDSVLKFIKDFKKKLKGGELRYGITERSDKTTMTYEFEYTEYSKAFDAMTQHNTLLAFAKASLGAYIITKFNTPTKGYICYDMKVVKIDNRVEVEFEISILRGKR